MNGIEAWSMVEIGEEYDGCPFYQVTTDMYGTGDSPTGHSCKAISWHQCSRAEDILMEIES